MGKTAVIYWSQTGNTEAMANAIVRGLKSAGEEVDILSVTSISANDALAYDKLALGCPSMGDEVLEEGEFEPFFADLEGRISGKKIALFGSYGWGDGQWMRDWQDRAIMAGAQLYQGEGLIVNDTPDDAATEECKAFGSGFASF